MGNLGIPQGSRGSVTLTALCFPSPSKSKLLYINLVVNSSPGNFKTNVKKKIAWLIIHKEFCFSVVCIFILSIIITIFDETEPTIVVSVSV